MPLSSEPLKAERRACVRKFLDIISQSEGETKKTVIAKGQFVLGSSLSTVYNYYGMLEDMGMIVEHDRQVWTAKTYQARVQANLVHEAEVEKRLTATVSLDAYDFERT